MIVGQAWVDGGRAIGADANLFQVAGAVEGGGCREENIDGGVGAVAVRVPSANFTKFEPTGNLSVDVRLEMRLGAAGVLGYEACLDVDGRVVDDMERSVRVCDKRGFGDSIHMSGEEG